MLAAALCSLLAVAPSPGHPQTVWAPTAELATEDRRAAVRVGLGAQDTILGAEPPQKGLGLVPGLRQPLWTDVRVTLNRRPVGALQTLQLTAGTLINYDNFVPFVGSLRLLTRPLSGGLWLGVEPHIGSGLDYNLYGLKTYASRRWRWVFATGGAQIGAGLAASGTRPFANAFGGAGVVVVPRFVSLSAEGGAGSGHRRLVSTNVGLDLWGFKVGGGATHAFIAGDYHLGFQVVLSFPLASGTGPP